MGCNCGKKAQASGYVYVASDGSTKRYATEVEAKAAKIRAGGTGEVRPA